MNAFFLHHRNGASLTNIFDVTAHSTSLFQENEQPKNTNGIFIPQAGISIAEPVYVQTDELGNNIVQMYQRIGIINDEKVPGLESKLHHMNENFAFSKSDTAINERHCHTTKKQLQRRST